MTWPTHMASGILFTAVALDAVGVPVTVGALSIAALGALAPDLDAHESKIKHLKLSYGRGRKRVRFKPFYMVSEIITFIFGHRGFLHSFLSVFLLVLLATFMLYKLGGSHVWYLAFLFGYMGHILGDATTKMGVPILYPYKARFRLVPRVIALRTGGPLEYVFLVIFIFLFFLWMKHNPWFLQNITVL